MKVDIGTVGCLAMRGDDAVGGDLGGVMGVGTWLARQRVNDDGSMGRLW